MPTQEQIEMVIGHAMVDSQFRDWLFRDPKAACASMGVTISDAQAAYILGLSDGAKNTLNAGIGMMAPKVTPDWGSA